jgi:hypothetical protein
MLLFFLALLSIPSLASKHPGATRSTFIYRVT